MPKGLTFVINPEMPAASIDLFLKAMGDISRLLPDVDYAIHREHSSRRWVISRLQASSPTVTVEPLLGDQETIDAIAVGIRAVTIGTDQPPQYFTEQALQDLKRMQRLFVGRDRARSIVVSIDNQETGTIREDISEKANKILAYGYWNLVPLKGCWRGKTGCAPERVRGWGTIGTEGSI